MDRITLYGLMVKPIQRFPQFILLLQVRHFDSSFLKHAVGLAGSQGAEPPAASSGVSPGLHFSEDN